MNYKVVRPSELSASELDAWRALLGSSMAFRSPFLSPAFACMVDEVRGRVRVLVIESDDGELAFLPFEVRGRFAARPVGWPINAAQAVVGCDLNRFGSLYVPLARRGLLLLTVDHLIAEQHATVAGASERFPLPVMDLSDGFAAYVDDVRTRSKALVTTTERKARKMAREVGDVRFVFHEPDHDLLDLMISWKICQFGETGARNIIDEQGNRTLLHQLLDQRDESCAGTLSVVYAGKEPVAMHFGLRSPRELAYWFPTYAPKYGAYSPGNLLLLRLAEAVGEQGISRIHLGKAGEPYKERFKSYDDVVYGGRIVHPLLAPVTELLLEARAAVLGLLRARPKVYVGFGFGIGASMVAGNQDLFSFL
jgi:CelD/BcsL family acetyltransferase involved in cellulose biosynthesis